MQGAARTDCESAQPGRALTLVLAVPLLGGVLTGQAPPEDLPPGSDRVIRVATGALDAPDPDLRGEAALTLGALRHSPAYEGIARVARDPDPRASVRGTVALGLLGEPGVEVLLREMLEDSRSHPEPRGIAAAFATGLLPPDHPGILVEELVSRLQGTSYERQRPILAALLTGLATAHHPEKLHAFRSLLQDDANKDPVLRGLLVDLLGRHRGGLDLGSLEEILADGSRPERRAALVAMRAHVGELDEKRLRRLELRVRRDRDPEVRARALRLLTEARHLPALELAAEAVEDRHLPVAVQGVRSAVALGGRLMRDAVEDVILDVRSAERQRVLLGALPGKPGRRLLEGCEAIAADRGRPLPLRCRAAAVVAGAGRTAIAPLLRTLFAAAREPEQQAELARAIVALGGDPPALDNLGVDHPLRGTARLRALTAAGHEAARAELVERLSDPDNTTDERLELLRAWRRAQRPVPGSPPASELPQPLRGLLR